MFFVFLKNYEDFQNNIFELLVKARNMSIKKEFFMRKITKSLAAVLLIAILSMTFATTFASAESVSPRLSHMSNGAFSFSATANGGYIDVTYDCYDSFVRADLTVKIEKRYLLFFWSDVDTWSASSTEIEGHFFHTFNLTGSGTYRATFTLLITGDDGTVDTIERTIQSDY